MRNLIRGVIGLVSIISVSMASGDVFSLPLNCAGYYDINTPTWSYDFDFGVNFSEISHVYIDWSGGITGGLSQHQGSSQTIPTNGSLDALIGSELSTGIANANIIGGENTYPEPEPFNARSEFQLILSTWDYLLDGKDVIKIFYPASRTFPEIHIIDYGSAALNNATLVIEGTIAPEPSTFILLSLGFIKILRKKRQKD